MLCELEIEQPTVVMDRRWTGGADEWIDGRTEERMEGRTDRKTDERMHG